MDVLDYEALSAKVARQYGDEGLVTLKKGLDGLWLDDYVPSSPCSTAHYIDISTFTVIFDLGRQGDPGAPQDGRVVGIFGCSSPPKDKRDAYRMRGYLGKTSEVFGEGFDKGHFIAHSAGGDALDSINWFPQERKLNRGWSDQGVRYREMETYCAKTPGTFMMARPIYHDTSARPALLEFGILRNRVLEVCLFDNRPA
jgi:hypothetical protein